MARLDFTDKIKKEEKRKIMPIIIGLALVLITLALTYFVFQVPPTIKNLTWIIMLIIIIILLIAWYRAYYK